MRDSPRADFDEFVRTRSTGLLRTAYLLTGDRHAAEDLVQEVLEQMFAKWRRINENPEAYARRALVNRSTNRWRSRGRRPEAPLAHHDVAAPDHSDGVAVRGAVIAALRDLPPQQRAVVVLRYLDDLPVHEVAAALGCSDGTVKSNAAHALDRLRPVLGPMMTTERGER